MYSFTIIIGILIFCFLFLEKILKIYTKNIDNLFLDKPNLRSMHKSPTPTGGGILILITSIFSYIIWNYFNDLDISNHLVLKIFLISTPLSIISFYDDLKNISQKFRYIVQLFTGFFLLINSGLIEILKDNFNLFIFLLFIFFFLVFVTGIINITNFMDGIDGLVVGSFSVIFIALTIKFDLGLIFISSILLFFLRWNWQPALLFMGDSGSTLLGALFSGILINTQSYSEFFAILFLSTPLLIDSTTCLLWRYLNNYDVFSAHKMHLYQRLVIGGFSHKKVSIIYIASIIFISIFYLIDNLSLEILAAAIITFLGLLLNFKFASPLHKI